jgi:hypothetical protein
MCRKKKVVGITNWGINFYACGIAPNQNPILIPYDMRREKRAESKVNPKAQDGLIFLFPYPI